MMRMRVMAAIACAAALGGCSSLLGERGAIGLPAGGPNYAVGSTLSSRLSAADRAALSAAFTQAMASGGAAGGQSWSGPGAVGVVEPGQAYLLALAEDPSRRMSAPAGLAADVELETDLGAYVAKNTVNIRRAPAPDAMIIGELQGGDQFEALGRVVGQDWLLAARDGRVLGYVYAPLTRAAPGQDLVLAGGPVRRPTLCREFTQTLRVGDRSDMWSGVACRERGRWRVRMSPSS